MVKSIEAFGAACNRMLKAERPAGREKVRSLLSEILMDDKFISTHFGPDNTDPRKCLYEDEELGFVFLLMCILVLKRAHLMITGHNGQFMAKQMA